MKTANKTAARAKRKWQADPYILWKTAARCTGFNQVEQTTCALPGRLAWSELRDGTADNGDIETLTDIIAICIIATQHSDELVQQTVDAARAAMCAIADRYRRCQRWGVDAAALRDIPQVLDVYDVLLEHATGGQLAEWIDAIRSVKP